MNIICLNAHYTSSLTPEGTHLYREMNTNVAIRS